MKALKNFFSKIKQAFFFFLSLTKKVKLQRASLKEIIAFNQNLYALQADLQLAIKQNDTLQAELNCLRQRVQDMDIRALNKTYEGFKVTEIGKDTALVWVTPSDPELMTQNNFSQIRNAFKNIAPNVNVIATRHVDIKLFNRDQVKQIIEELNESIQKN